MQFSELDPEIRRIVDQLNQEALVPVQVLSDELQEYVEELDARSPHSEFFDDKTAKRIASLCWKLLDALPATPDKRQHRLTQLAINYFVLAEDAQDDHHSLAGFDDDLQVVVAAIQELELDLDELLEDEAADDDS